MAMGSKNSRDFYNLQNESFLIIYPLIFNRNQKNAIFAFLNIRIDDGYTIINGNLTNWRPI